MSEADFTVRWGDRSDSKFYAIDSGTYPVKVEDVTWRKSRADNDMCIVKFRFPEARVTKPERGMVMERGRVLDNIFMFDLDFQIESSFDYLVAAGAATEEELGTSEMKSDQVFKLFDSTQGAELAVKVGKRQADLNKNPNARVDDEGNENRIWNFYPKDSTQYERAANAIGATVDADKIVMGGKKKR